MHKPCHANSSPGVQGLDRVYPIYLRAGNIYTTTGPGSGSGRADRWWCLYFRPAVTATSDEQTTRNKRPPPLGFWGGEGFGSRPWVPDKVLGEKMARAGVWYQNPAPGTAGFLYPTPVRAIFSSRIFLSGARGGSKILRAGGGARPRTPGARASWAMTVFEGKLGLPEAGPNCFIKKLKNVKKEPRKCNGPVRVFPRSPDASTFVLTFFYIFLHFYIFYIFLHFQGSLDSSKFAFEIRL